MQISRLSRWRGNHHHFWSSEDLLRFSDGEIHFLWYFIQGSIMNPETRWNLRHNWGMCDRHSFGFVAAEAAYRHGFLMGQAVLYQDLMERAAAAFKTFAPVSAFNILFKLRETKPCFMCKLGYDLTSGSPSHFEFIEEGRNLDPIRAFARETAPYWRDLVCGCCAGNDSPSRCRIHLRKELVRGRADIAGQRAMVQYISHHVSRYMESFVWGCPYPATVEDRAALIESIGWLAGWKPWLRLMGEPIRNNRVIEKN